MADEVPKWKKERDNLRAAMKAARDMKVALANGVDIKDIPVAPPPADDRVPCPKCGRKVSFINPAHQII